MRRILFANRQRGDARRDAAAARSPTVGPPKLARVCCRKRQPASGKSPGRADRQAGTPMSRKDHWDTIYETKREEQCSWFQPNPAPSLRMLDAAGIDSAT
jgi:hypothetical protein